MQQRIEDEGREESKKARGDHNSRHLLALARHYQRRHRRWSGMMSRGIKQRDVRPAWNSRKYIHQAGRVISRVIGGCDKIPAISCYLMRHNRLICNAITAFPLPPHRPTPPRRAGWNPDAEGLARKGNIGDPDASLT